MRLIFVAAMIALLSTQALALPKNLPELTLKGEEGGRVDGKPWSSKELTGKVHVLFYVDPDEKDLNEHVADRLKKEDFPGRISLPYRHHTISTSMMQE